MEKWPGSQVRVQYLPHFLLLWGKLTVNRPTVDGLLHTGRADLMTVVLVLLRGSCSPTEVHTRGPIFHLWRWPGLEGKQEVVRTMNSGPYSGPASPKGHL